MNAESTRSADVVRLLVGVCVAVALCGLTASCSGSTGTPLAHTAQRPQSTRTVDPRPPAPHGPLTVQILSRLPLKGQHGVAALRIFGHFLSWAGCTRCHANDQPTQLFVADLSAHTVKPVARTRWPHGTIDWTAGSGDYVAWDDVSRVPADIHPRVKWTVRAMDLRTHQQWVVASSHGQPTEFIPLLHADGGRLVWVAPDPDSRTNDLVVYDLRRRRATIAKRHVLAFDAALSGRWVVYDDDWPAGQPGADLNAPPKAREVYAVPVHGGRSVDVGGDHRATTPAAGSGYVVWGEPMYGDQKTIWVRRLSGGPAQIVYRGKNVQREVGRGFVALWPNVGPLTVVPLQPGHPGPAVDITGGRDIYVPAHFAVDGDRLAHATAQHEGGPDELITIEVDRVQPTAS